MVELKFYGGKLIKQMVCSMEACLFYSLTSLWIGGFSTVISAQTASFQLLRPWNDNPLYDEKSKKTQKAGKNSYSYYCPASNVAVRLSCVTGQPTVQIHPCTLLLHVLKMVSLLFLNVHCKSRTLSSTAQPQQILPFRGPQARLQHNWTDIPGCGTSWKASSYWCVAADEIIFIKGQAVVNMRMDMAYH